MTRRTTSAVSTRSSTDLRRLTTAAVATALVFLFTFLIKVPTVIGYIHLGDAFVLLYAALTGDPLALLVGALGGPSSCRSERNRRMAKTARRS